MPNRALPALVLLAALVAGAAAQASPAPSPTEAGMDCTSALLNMSTCLTFVEEGSKLKVPDEGCCSGLSGLIGSSPACLCQLLSTGEVLGFNIDKAQAIKLPAACNVSTPPVTLCAVLGFPVDIPMGPVASPLSGGPSPLSGGPSPASGASDLSVGSNPTLAPAAANGVSSSFRVADFWFLINLSWAGLGLVLL